MGKIAFVFSGQGAQHPGMGKELAACSSMAKAVFGMADSVRPGTSLQCFEGTKEELSVTANTQPCVFATDLAAAQAVEQAGIHPDCVAGFSLGEIAAIAFAGILPHREAFELVCKRAQLMNAAAEKNKGAMVAVLKLDAKKVETLCAGYYNKAWPVNYNSPGQTVVACSQDSAEEFCADVKTAGGRAVRLEVSGAFHSPFMEEAADGLREYLKDLSVRKPNLDIYANVTAQPYGEDIKDLVALQCKSPVLWQKTIENMANTGVDTFIEVGVGKTLAGLIKKILPDAVIFNVEDKEGLDAVTAALGR